MVSFMSGDALLINDSQYLLFYLSHCRNRIENRPDDCAISYQELLFQYVFFESIQKVLLVALSDSSHSAHYYTPPHI